LTCPCGYGYFADFRRLIYKLKEKRGKRMPDTTLKITTNALNDNNVLWPHLELENECYEVSIDYIGDFINDKKNNKIDKKLIKISGKSKVTGLFAPKISGTANNISVVTQNTYLPDFKTIDMFIDNLRFATETIAEVYDVLKEYFLVS
jgi:hypothetical protein